MRPHDRRGITRGGFLGMCPHGRPGIQRIHEVEVHQLANRGKKVALGSDASIFGRRRPGMCAMVCIAHVGTRNVSVDRPLLLSSEIRLLLIQGKIAAARKSPSASDESENGRGCSDDILCHSQTHLRRRATFLRPAIFSWIRSSRISELRRSWAIN